MTYTTKQMIDTLRRYGATLEEAMVLTTIAKLESGFRTDARSPVTASDEKYGGAYGLFQHLKEYWPSRSKAAGLGSNADINDPINNIKVALYLYKNTSNGLNHWSAYKRDDFGTHLGKIEQEVNTLAYSDPSYRYSPTSLTSVASKPRTSSTFDTTMGEGDQFYGDTTGYTNGADGPIALPTDGKFYKVDGKVYMMVTIGGAGNTGPTLGRGNRSTASTSTGMASATIFFEVPSGTDGVTNPTVMSAATWKSQVTTKGWIDGGSAEAFAGMEAGQTVGEMFERVLWEMGLYGSDALNDQGVINVMAEMLARPDMSATEFQTRLQQTDYWKQTTDQGRIWNDLSPAQQEQNLMDQAGVVAGLWFTYTGESINLADYDADGNGTVSHSELMKGNKVLGEMALAVASGKKTQQQIINDTIKPAALEFAESPYNRIVRSEKQEQGKYGVTVSNKAAEIAMEYRRWGIPISDREAESLATKVVMNEMADADWLDSLKDSAQALYPNKARDIATLDWARPYMSTYEQLMEAPQPDLMDASIQSALTSGMSLSDYQTTIRKSDAWKGTANAKAQFNSKANNIGRMMGFV